MGKVSVICLPPGPKGEKVGVDDYLVQGHSIGDLHKLAVEPPDRAAHPSGEEMLSGILRDVERSRLGPGQAVSILCTSAVPLHIRRTLVSRLVISLLKKRGRFLKCAANRFYFRTEKKQLFEIDSFEFSAFLSDLFGLNQTEQDFKFVQADLHTEAHLRGEETEIRRVSYYDRGNNILYVDRFDGQMYRLNGQSIELVDNGTDGVLFNKGPDWKPYRYAEGIPSNGLLTQTLVDDIPFQRDVFAPIMPDQQRMTFSLWLFSLFFESLLPTKPILALIGEKGSGKTTALRRVLRFLFGPGADVTALEREREDAFVAAITHGYLVILDNLDGKIAWINDRLAVAATGSLIQRRRLYTTNEAVAYHPKCFLAITSRNPKFKRDDVVDRLLLLKVERLEHFAPERELLEAVDARRDELWSELLSDLNEIVAALRQSTIKPDIQFRMSDWADLCWRIAEQQGVGAEFLSILKQLSTEQSAFLLEDDLLYICLLAWLENPRNSGREVNAGILYNELNEIALREKMEWPYNNTMSLAKRLNNVKSNLAQLIPLTIRRDARRRTFYTFQAIVGCPDEVTR